MGRVGDTPDILARVAVGHSLTCLQAELEISQALLVLLPGDVDPGLLAGVELGVADPAVVLQGGGEGHRAHHVPEEIKSVTQQFKEHLSVLDCICVVMRFHVLSYLVIYCHMLSYITIYCPMLL